MIHSRVVRKTEHGLLSPSRQRRHRRRPATPRPRASYNDDGPPPPPPPPPPSSSGPPVLFEVPPPPPPPPRMSTPSAPTTRRQAIGAGLLFAGALAGFSLSFGRGNRNSGGVVEQGPGAPPRPYRVVDGRVFVRTSAGDVLAVRRAPEDGGDEAARRTLVLVGDSGSYLLRVSRGARVEGMSDDQFLTSVFATGAWEKALVPLEPGSGGEGSE